MCLVFASTFASIFFRMSCGIMGVEYSRKGGVGMFRNPGGKLKIIAYVCFGAYILLGLFMFSQFLIDIDITDSDFVAILLGFIVGGIVGLVNGIMLYAFGELVENVEHMQRNLYITTDLLEKQFKNSSEEPPASGTGYTAQNRWGD